MPPQKRTKKPPLEETPEEHVHESVERQQKAAQVVATTAKRTAKTAADKATVLAKATQELSEKVGTLVDVVQTNTKKIDELQHELNMKPDDVELKLIASVSAHERRVLFRKTILAAALIALTSGFTAFEVAEFQGKERCKINAANIDALARLLESLPDGEKRFQPTISILRDNRNEC